MLRTGQLVSFSADLDQVRAVLDLAVDDLEEAKERASARPSRAYVTAYDAGMKALAAFLQAQGLRITSKEGHHKALLEAIEAQLGRPLGAHLTTLRAMNKTRQALQYPVGAVTLPSQEEVNAAIEAVDAIYRGVAKLVDAEVVPVFRG